MPTQIEYSPSVNIIRDRNRAIRYIVTPNAAQAANVICDNIAQGSRVFNLIGSFGTGKSSFLWAFEQSAVSSKHYFQLPFGQKSKIQFLNFTGEYKSLKSFFAHHFGIETSDALLTKNIFAAIFQEYHALSKGNKMLFVLIDEFGKFLEYAAKNNPEEELYFIQQLAEFISNPAHNIILITTTHQNFEAYSHHLSSIQRQEWAKVKGRFKEISFNETVEQLLYLAAERLDQKSFEKPNEASVKILCDLFTRSKAFGAKPDFAEKTGLKLYPLDLFAANIMTLALQRYGQNERSLFSFLENPDHTGLQAHQKKNNLFYDLSNVYDYLIFNFYSYLASPSNQDRAAWAGIKNALDKIETEWDADIAEAHKVVKSVALLHQFAQNGATLDKEFITTYADKALGIASAEKIIDKLVDHKILLYRKYAKRFIVFDGTDVDIYQTLEAAGRQLEITDVATLVEKHYTLSPILAKAYYYQTGTPRLFEFKISNYPLEKLLPQGEIDGFINLVFNDKLTEKEIIKTSSVQEEAVLYGFYRNTKAIKELLYEIERSQKALKEVNERDKVARKEFENILNHQQTLLNHYILNNLYSDSGDICWVFKGEIQKISNKRAFNGGLSAICHNLYHKAPHYKNELVNRHKLPAPLYAAKRNYIKALAANWGQENLGFEKDKFPPEKTIFITLLRENGLAADPLQPNEHTSVRENSTFAPLWDICDEYLSSTRKGRRRIAELTEILSKRPLKLKQGLVEFWLPSYLFIRRNDFALFHKGIFIPNLTDEILELIAKYPHEYEIKAFDLEGIRLDIFNSYRLLLNQRETDQPTQKTFIETIKPFLVFFKSLPEYAKHTKRLSKEAFAIRTAIATSTDPEKTFFEDFPVALGCTMRDLQSKKQDLESYSQRLHEAIREIRTCFDELLNRIEGFVQTDIMYEAFTFEAYKEALQNRYKNLKKHLLLPHQKTFVQRLYSELDDRRAWLGSLVHALTGKTIETLRDEDEIVLYDKLKSMISDLDNLTNISRADVNEEKESVIQLEITSFEAIQKKILRLPKQKQTEVSTLQEKLKAQLGTDETMNVAALMQLLQDLVKNKTS